MEVEKKRIRIAQRAGRQSKELIDVLGEHVFVPNIGTSAGVVPLGKNRPNEHFGAPDGSAADENPSELLCRPQSDVSDATQTGGVADAILHPDSCAAGDVCGKLLYLQDLRPSPDDTLSNESATGDSKNFGRELQTWAVSHRIKRDALGDLLKILRQHPCHSALPSDARTLLKTPRGSCSECPITVLSPGHYCHFGLHRGLLRALSGRAQLPETLLLSFNIDGLPLSKSSSVQLWPIQCLVVNCNKQAPFLVGAYAGPSKPESANDFLLPFVTELKGLLEDGLIANGCSITVSVKAIICDAPARSFILSTKGHSGYSSCPKCTCEGDYRGGRVVLLDTGCEMRTDGSFRQQEDVDHHKGTSVLVDLPVDIVRDVPLDYMHLVLLGVVKKLLLLWLSGPLSIRVGPLERKLMNEASENLKQHIPVEFSRKTRPVTEVERWKAAELRLFLFYTGPLILKSVLSPNLYENFIVLHSSLSILANNELCSHHADYAGALLRHFVRTFTTIYGEEQVSYNVHCLIHLAEDVKFHGAVDTFSAFPFENNMRHIKKELRKHEKPLQQLRNRMLERLQLPPVSFEDSADFELIRPQDTGPLPPECTGPEFGAVRCGTFLLSGSIGNNCVVLDDHIIVVQKFCYLKASNEVCVAGQEFYHREDFYTSPFESSRIGIFLVSKLSRHKVWPLRNPKKMLLLPHGSQYIVLPEIHVN